MIREYQPGRDTPSLRECIVELREFEWRIESALPAGSAMADALPNPCSFLIEKQNRKANGFVRQSFNGPMTQRSASSHHG